MRWKIRKRTFGESEVEFRIAPGELCQVFPLAAATAVPDGRRARRLCCAWFCGRGARRFTIHHSRSAF
jgi:hypothetical protein